MTIRLEHVQPWHVRYLAQHVREADRREWEVAVGETTNLRTAIWGCISNSYECYTALNEFDDVLCIFGVSDAGQVYVEGGHADGGLIGGIWLIGSEKGQEAAAEVHKTYWQTIKDRWQKRYGQLQAHILLENVEHVKWLEHLGFENKGPSPFIQKDGFALYVL